MVGGDLREKLLGAWTLISCERHAADGSIVYPMGRAPIGRLFYTDDGHVAVNLMQPGRPRGRHDLRIAALPDAEAAVLARGYMAYAGPFEVDEERAVVRHHFELCLDPDLIGTLQERLVTWFDGELELSVPNTMIDHVEQSSKLRWRRC